MRKTASQTTMVMVLVCVMVLFAAVSFAAPTEKTNKDLYYQGSGGSQSSGASQAQDTGTKPVVRYWVERADSGGRDITVGEKASFHSGDRIYFKFSTNVDCYSYLVCKGTSGKVSMMFPGIAGRDNHVSRYSETTVPTINVPFVFDQTPGTEKLCLVVSPTPVEDWQNMAGQARGLDKPLELNASQEGLWERVVSKCATLSGTKDLTLEQYENNADGQGGNYVADHAGSFTRPMALYMDLEHRP